MLKTNSKAVKAAIREFIAAGAIDWALSANEYDRENGYEPIQSIFNSWVRGLPGVVGSEDFLFCNAVDFMAGILQESEAEKARYDETEAEDLAAYLVWREVSKLARGL